MGCGSSVLVSVVENNHSPEQVLDDVIAPGSITSKRFVTFEELSAELQPLDLLVVHGGAWESRAIEFLQKLSLGSGEYSHVGVVVNQALLGGKITNGDPNEWYIWESTDPPAPPAPCDVETGQYVNGIQIRRLSTLVKSGGNIRVAWARLAQNPWLPSATTSIPVTAATSSPSSTSSSSGSASAVGHVGDASQVTDQAENEALDVSGGRCARTDTLTPALLERRAQISSALGELLEKIRGRPFNFNPAHSIPALIPADSVGHQMGGTSKFHRIQVPSDLPSEFFCSQLAATIYKTVGVLPPFLEASDVAPMEFLGRSNDGISGKMFELPVRPLRYDWDGKIWRKDGNESATHILISEVIEN